MKLRNYKISIIIPVYNEEAVISEFYKRLKKITLKLKSYEFEYIFINDGSTDNTAEILNKYASSNKQCKILHFAHNQGHQTAITAGMDFASGEIIITIDADLQDPPELIKDLIAKIIQGYDIVHTKRKIRLGETPFKLATAWSFYKLMKFFLARDLIENCGDYRAFTKSVLQVIRTYREPHRYLRGTFAIIGFKQGFIYYNRDARFAGKTKYSFGKMFRLAINGILSFSSSPIRVISWISFFLWIISFTYLIYALLNYFVYKNAVQGWTSLIFFLTFYTGIILFSLAIIGSYIGRIFEQGQDRPLYWLVDSRNINIDEIDKNTNIKELQLAKKVMNK